VPAPAANFATSLLERVRAEGWESRVALRQGDRAWTYAQLSAQVGRVASALRSLRVSPGERVALLMRDTLEAAASLLGTIHAGAIAVPLSELSTATDVKDYLLHSGAAVAIVEASLEPALDEIRAELPALREVLCVGAGAAGLRDFHAMVTAASPHAPSGGGSATDTCVLLYSAGAGPDELRGVAHSAATITAAYQAFAGALALRAGDRILSTVRLSTAFGLGCGLLFPLSIGAEAALMPEQPRSDALLAAIDRFVPTVMCSTPTVFGQLARDVATMQRPQPLADLRRAVAGAEGLPQSQEQRIRDVLGVPLTVGFGLTETFSFVLAVSSGEPGWEARGGGCGQPLAGVGARVVDEAGAPVEPDVIGTLQLRTAALFSGYWGAEAGQGDGRDADGWFTTRDRFMIDRAGMFHHCGRIDELFKVGGKWVSPQEIERVLTAHEAVWECAVIGADDEDGFVKPLAFVVANVGEAVGPELEARLTAYVKQTLAPYKYPRWIEFVDDLPRGPSGKILRYRLRAPRRRRRGETGHR
jgi:acyl-coenzyme A synthetase/AMP-(fatty) acid ligase